MKKQMITKEARFNKQHKRAWFVAALITAPIHLPIGLWLYIGDKIDPVHEYMCKVVARLSWLICYWCGVEGFFYKDIPEGDDDDE